MDEEVDEFSQTLVFESVTIKDGWIVGKKTDSKENNYRVIPKEHVAQITEPGDELNNVGFDQ